jgi:hypothetical protein
MSNGDAWVTSTEANLHSMGRRLLVRGACYVVEPITRLGVSGDCESAWPDNLGQSGSAHRYQIAHFGKLVETSFGSCDRGGRKSEGSPHV